MIVEQIFKHPHDTLEQRIARFHEIITPFFQEIMKTRPEYAMKVLYAEKFDENGDVYYENGFGELFTMEL